MVEMQSETSLMLHRSSLLAQKVDSMSAVKCTLSRALERVLTSLSLSLCLSGTDLTCA